MGFSAHYIPDSDPNLFLLPGKPVEISTWRGNFAIDSLNKFRHIAMARNCADLLTI